MKYHILVHLANGCQYRSKTYAHDDPDTSLERTYELAAKAVNGDLKSLWFETNYGRVFIPGSLLATAVIDVVVGAA